MWLGLGLKLMKPIEGAHIIEDMKTLEPLGSN